MSSVQAHVERPGAMLLQAAQYGAVRGTCKDVRAYVSMPCEHNLWSCPHRVPCRHVWRMLLLHPLPNEQCTGPAMGLCRSPPLPLQCCTTEGQMGPTRGGANGALPGPLFRCPESCTYEHVFVWAPAGNTRIPGSLLPLPPFPALLRPLL